MARSKRPGTRHRPNLLVILFFGVALALPKTPAAAAEPPQQVISVPSDQRATYRLLSVAAGKKGSAIVVTKRVGSSGQSHSRRECTCPVASFRYLGDGEALVDAMRDREPADKLAPIEATANGAWPPSFYVCIEACRAIGKASPSKQVATPPPQKPTITEFDIRSRALIYCQRYARAASRFPSSVNFSGWNAAVDVRADGSATVTAPFTAKNALGAELPHKIGCMVSADGDIKAEISED